jgi:hypothetical protein
MDDEIPVLENSKKKLKFVSKGFQHFRDQILSTVQGLTFREKLYCIKEADRDLLERMNTHAGTKAVHTLDYVHKFPSRKKDLKIVDECRLTLRTLWVGLAVKEYYNERKNYYNERRKSMIRVIK